MIKTSFNPDEPYTPGEEQKKGKLKIFLGILPGVGKSSAMLRAAHLQVANGQQVVIGIVTWQSRPDTIALMGNLPVVPYENISYNGSSYKEMNTKAILDMHPGLVVVPDPAHINVPGSRHLKRFHDIFEILDNGIDVYTVLNMVQLESYTEFIHQTVGYYVPVVPDELLTRADEVEVVDVEPDILIKRQREGKVFIPGFSEKVVENTYQKDKIIVIRRTFFQMIMDNESWKNKRIHWTAEPKTRLLAPIWPDMATSHVIRQAKAISAIIDANWIALYVETKRKLNDYEKAQLEENIKLARRLGGIFITHTCNDPLEAIVEVSRREKVSHIILGKTRKGRIAGCPDKYFLRRLLEYNGRINVTIVCGGADHKRKQFNINRPIPGLKIKLITVAVSLITGLLCTLLNNKTTTDAFPYIIQLLLFVLAAPMRAGSGLILAVLTLLAGLILVIPPSFTLLFDPVRDAPILFLFSFISLLNGFLTVRLRTNELETSRREKQTNALFLLTKNLSEATGIGDIVETSTGNLLRYFNVHVFFIFRDAEQQLTDFKFIIQGLVLSEQEIETADWVFKHDKPAGRFTDIMATREYTYYPLIGKGQSMGVLGVKQEKLFDGKDNISWNAFLSQIAQSIEHQFLKIAALQTNLLNESDRLYKTLFNSISHELRIPLSTIMGASDMLLAYPHSEQARQALCEEIFGSSKRLNRLVENLLNMSRLESGRIAMHPNWCDIHDLFNRVAEGLKEDLQPFRFEIVVPEWMPLVRIDYGLMEQVIYNLVYNATQYAPSGTSIRLSTCYENGFLVILVTDRGPGFDSEMLDMVFNKFWRPRGEKPGGLGLGLSIVKGFVEAHNGTVFVANRKGGGARFTIMILTEKSSYTSKIDNTNEEC